MLCREHELRIIMYSLVCCAEATGSYSHVTHICNEVRYLGLAHEVTQYIRFLPIHKSSDEVAYYLLVLIGLYSICRSLWQSVVPILP